MRRIIAAIPVLMLFTIILSSCEKERCKGVYCANNGTCSKGKCTCPAGYSGVSCNDLDSTEIDYYNNTFTPVDISINGYEKTIPVGGFVAYKGVYGYFAIGTASTFNTNSSGTQVGLHLYWNLSDSFYAEARRVNINVPPSYFFLKITNSSSSDINEVFVNYGLDAQTLDYITVPKTGVTYNIGYYSAKANSNLYLTSGVSSWNKNLDLPFTENQYYSFVAGN